MKNIRTVCLDCGNKYKTKDKSCFGMWKDTCDICGKKKLCAAAGHDFGIYNNKHERQADAIQDLI